MKDHETEVNKRLANAQSEASRYQFTYEHTTAKGQWLQWFLKKLIAKSIHFWYGLIKGKYDKNAYVFQDPRLFMIQQFIKNYAKDNMEERKQEIINEAADIFLFLLKEDIFYRVRAMDAIRLWGHLYPGMKWKDEPLYGLDEPEQENLQLWKGQ